MRLDLASFASIRSFAKEYQRAGLPCDVLLANAGVMFCPYAQTEEGLEMQWGVNHIGHALLVRLLLPTLRKAAAARIVIVASLAHAFVRRADPRKVASANGFDTHRAYGTSKLANVLYARGLQRHLQSCGDNITVVSLHPGTVLTDLLYVVAAALWVAWLCLTEWCFTLLGVTCPSPYLSLHACWGAW